MEYKVLGISSGIGVSLFPFRKNLVGNIENRSIFHSPGNPQWASNFGKIPLERKLIENLEADVVISSPDCGSGSVLRFSRAKKLGDHKLNESLSLFFEGIAKYKPKFFEFENLEGLFKSFPEEEFGWLLRDYRLIKHVAPVSMWGNSQIYRKRLVIVGVRKDLDPRIDKYFRLPDYRDQNKTCVELYGDLDIPENDTSGWKFGNIREKSDIITTIYAGKKLYNWQITNHWQKDLKNKKRWEVTDRKFKNAPGVYRNRKKDYPATARKANRQYDHNGLMLTPRQLARVQGVPDDFVLYMGEDLSKVNYWINKSRAAVTKTPPYEISAWFKKKLDKTKKLRLW